MAPRQGVVSAIFYSVSITAMHAFAGDPLRASSLTILSVILGFPRSLICLAIKGGKKVVLTGVSISKSDFVQPRQERKQVIFNSGQRRVVIAPST